MKKKAHKLDFQISYDFYLFGMVCDERDYRLAWLLNRDLGLLFERMDNLTIPQSEPGLTQEFSHYLHVDENTHTGYHLIGNRSENGYLLDEIRNIDYFLKIQPEDEEALDARWINSLRKLAYIRGLFQLETGVLRSGQKLLF